ncbi:UNVERIFIED_CONTAM: hypothetical protein PYX00_005571 [Menopon gallinae]|uniref:Huntingtin interacting protein 1 n=1 Tax=Menopon gallinae TaxID=328185 RepID=A0AAW2HRY9_9NEOP
MASLSLPRVLQQRKTSLELERENFEKSQTISINKAINNQESPVKEKHVRSTIIGTYQEKDGKTFWLVVSKLPLQDNRIVAWKFCHVLHKVLREGHPQVLVHSQRHREMIENLGKLWCHLREGYGKLIQDYTRFLITKLDFHRRNPRFPGNLVVTEEELESIGENDINNYFQMSVEMFDYMDDILTLQASVFGSLDMSRCNSMMSSGQCRLAPLIPCIQDSSRLYDYCVKILFRLHSSLPPDTLFGHRQRFLQQFKILREFYLNASNLQYFKFLIQIPLLPENPPNFLIEADLRTYVSPVVVMPEEEQEPDQADGFLVDTSTPSASEPDTMQRNGSISPDQKRDGLIEQLQNEKVRLREKIQQIMMEHQKITEELRDKVAELETDLATRDSELLQERQLKEDLLRHTEEASKYHEYEKRAKTMEEKFQKLKDVYTVLREEHIQLIRAKAEVDKQLLFARHASEEANRLKEEISLQMNELLHEKNVIEENLSKSGNLVGELDFAKKEKEAVEAEKLTLQARFEEVNSQKAALEVEIKDLRAEKENLDVRLRASEDEIKNIQRNLIEQNNKLQREILEACLAECEQILKYNLDEVDNPALSASTSSPHYFTTLIDPTKESVLNLENSYVEFDKGGRVKVEPLIVKSIRFATCIGNYVVQGKTTSNSSRDIEFGEKIAEACKQVGSEALVLLSSIKSQSPLDTIRTESERVKEKISEVATLMEELTRALEGDSIDVLHELVDSELVAMEKAIEEAAKGIENMLNESRKSHVGVKLEVSEKILDSCTNLMAAVRLLIQKSRLLQAEIVSQGKGTHSTKEFYKRNHQWTEGLISAAKAVATGARFLLTCADNVVAGQGKFEQLIVASQGIAASTAQLVVASRVKADRNSENLKNLSGASKGVTQATANVVATAKSCSQLVEETEALEMLLLLSNLYFNPEISVRYPCLQLLL